MLATWVVAVLLPLALAAGDAVTPAVLREVDLTPSPAMFQQVHLALGDKSDEMRVTWVSPKSATVDEQVSPAVKYGTVPHAYEKAVAAVSQTYTDGDWTGVLYTAVLKELEPGTTYYYVVGFQSLNNWSGELRLRTLPPPASSVSLIAYGDTGMRSHAEDLVKKLRLVLPNTDLILHLGDFCYAPEGMSQKWNVEDSFYASLKQYSWDKWFNLFEPISSSIPYMTIPGNHEQLPYDFQLGPYAQRFQMPLPAASLSRPLDQRTFYSFNIPSAHIVGLNSELDYAEGSDQIQWLHEDLAAVDRQAYPWVIFMVHRPMYSSSVKRGSVLPLRKVLEPIMRQYQVDLVLTGHDHSYERTFPVFNGTVDRHILHGEKSEYAGPADPVHIKVGTGGLEVDGRFHSLPDWTAFRSADHFGYLRVTLKTAELDSGAQEHRLITEFIPVTVHADIDTMTIVKRTQGGGGGATGRPNWVPVLMFVACCGVILFYLCKPKARYQYGNTPLPQYWKV